MAGCGGEEGAQSVLRELSWIERSKPGRHMGIQNRPSSNISCKLQQSATWRERGGCSKRSWLLCGMGWDGSGDRAGSMMVAHMAKQNSVFAKQETAL